MTSNQATYTMPIKQLLKLLETTADEAPHNARRPRRRLEAKSVPTVARPEPETAR